MPTRPQKPIRRKSSSAAHQKLRARVIAEEDVCGVCGQEVDKRLSGDDMLGPTMGHIISVRERPDLELVRWNVELQHRRCNLEEGS